MSLLLSSTSPLRLRALDVVLKLRPARAALLSQLQLLEELALLEWQQEQQRLLRMLLLILLGYVLLACTLLLASGAVLVLSWNTTLRIPVLIGLPLLHGLLLAICWRRLRRMIAQGTHSFAGTRAEFAANLALLKEAL